MTCSMISSRFFSIRPGPISCGYFERDDMTLEEAQFAKIDLALNKLGLRAGMTLLAVGCGWGSTLQRAVERYDVNVVGLTLSKNQAVYVHSKFAKTDSPRSRRVLFAGWEEFDEPVDRIVSIGAFEHFGHDRYHDFFTMPRSVLPDDGVLLLHTITGLTGKQMVDRGMPLTVALARFMKFIVTEIFPGSRLPSIEMAQERSSKAGFTLARRQSLQPHYVTTLNRWAEVLQAYRGDAIEIQSEEVYQRYLHCLTGCAKGFRIGYIDVNQFTLVK